MRKNSKPRRKTAGAGGLETAKAAVILSECQRVEGSWHEADRHSAVPGYLPILGSSLCPRKFLDINFPYCYYTYKAVLFCFDIPNTSQEKGE